MKEGKVKFYNTTKGYGFITPIDGSKEVFFHATSVIGTKPNEGSDVQFKTEEGKRGICAIDVTSI